MFRKKRLLATSIKRIAISTTLNREMSGLSRALCSNSMRPIFIALSGLLVASSVSADPVVNGIVGESVVLPAGLSPQDNPTEVEWKWGGKIIADKDNSDVTTVQFRDRLHLNRTDWSLTINLLRAEDSGEYNRVAREASGGQFPTHTVTLHVYEKIESEVTRNPSNETCRATLLCTTNQQEHVSYRWKRGDQDLPEHAGILEVSLIPGEINVIFTCIASNPVSEATASIRESCAGLLVASSVSADPVVNGIVGESVVLLAVFSQQSDITGVEWSFGTDVIANEGNINGTKQFKDRVHLKRREWSLTINLLRAEDSGEYNCAFETATGQLPTQAVTLRVYEKIESKVTRKPPKETCRVTLLCTTNQTEHVSYRWKRGDQDLPEHAGILEVSLNPGEINVIFTCIASNPASEATASIRESCADTAHWQIYAGTAGILLLVVLISIVITVAVRKKKKRSEAVTETPEQATVYAQIQRQTTQWNHVENSSNAQQNDNLPTTVYATVNLKQAPEKSCETQYDVVKFNRNEETSPYQSVQ